MSSASTVPTSTPAPGALPTSDVRDPDEDQRLPWLVVTSGGEALAPLQELACTIGRPLQARYVRARTYWFFGGRGNAPPAWQSGSASNKFSVWVKRCTAMRHVVAYGGEPPRDG